MNTMPIKDPDAILDYTIDWTPELAGDTISTSAWVYPTDLTKTDESKTLTTTTVWFSGGVANTKYSVRNRIVTAGGRTNDRTFYLPVGER